MVSRAAYMPNFYIGPVKDKGVHGAGPLSYTTSPAVLRAIIGVDIFWWGVHWWWGCSGAGIVSRVVAC